MIEVMGISGFAAGVSWVRLGVLGRKRDLLFGLLLLSVPDCSPDAPRSSYGCRRVMSTRGRSYRDGFGTGVHPVDASPDILLAVSRVTASDYHRYMGLRGHVGGNLVWEPGSHE